MTRVVLDTNVLVSSVRAERGALAIIREGWLTGRFQVYVSEPLLAEVARTLAKPYFATRLGPDRTQQFLALLKRATVLQPITERVVGVVTHAEADWILATAHNARARFLVTGDCGLVAGRRQGALVRLLHNRQREGLGQLPTHHITREPVQDSPQGEAGPGGGYRC